MARFPRRNPLAYPSGAAPGFDPTHPASQGVRAGKGGSAVFAAASFYDVSSGAAYTQNGGSLQAQIRAGMGPCGNSYANIGYYALANQPTFTPSAITFAAIFTLDNGGNTTNIAFDGGNQFGTDSSNNLFVYSTSGATSSLACSVGTPYFAAASYDAVSAVFVLVNLRTGQISSQSVATDTIVATTGTITLAGRNGLQSLQGALSAACISYNKKLSIPQLLQWAQSPWDFWYPQKRISSSSGSSITAFFRRTLAFLGSRIGTRQVQK